MTQEFINQFGLWIGIIGGVLGIFTSMLSVYQWAIIREGKSKLFEVQFLIAGINSAAIFQQQAWNNQIALLKNVDSEKDLEIYRILIRARDDAAAIAQLAVSMESSVNADTSAIQENLRKSIDSQKLTNQLQEEALKNPLSQRT